MTILRSSAILAGVSCMAMLAALFPAGASASSPNSYGSNSYSNSSSSNRSQATGDQNWGGFYAGLHVGMVWGDFGGASAGVQGPSGTDTSVMGGVQAGYNWQMDRIVLGAEADFSELSIEEGTANGGKLEENWDSTLRARAGYTFGQWLPYATVGLGFTNTDSKDAGGTANNTHVGYALGAGFDYAIMNNLSWRTEYLHVDVPYESDTINGHAFNGGAGNNIIRIGANYRFH